MVTTAQRQIDLGMNDSAKYGRPYFSKGDEIPKEFAERHAKVGQYIFNYNAKIPKKPVKVVEPKAGKKKSRGRPRKR